nr:glycosylated lysosomal membrane protein isoform X2 [Manis javanica]
MCGSEEPCWGLSAPGPTLLLSLLLSAAPSGLLGEETRQVSLEVSPDWPVPHLLHIRAVGTNSTLHYVWSSLGPPAVLLVATNTPNSTLSIDWVRLLSSEPDGGLMVLPKDSIQFSSALVFTRLFEFDSTNTSDTAEKPPGKPYTPYSLANFSWSNITDSLDPATLSATFQGHPTHDPTRAFANGSLALRVQAFSRTSRPAQPPRLLHTADTCQLEVALVGASPRGNGSLFGLEVATVGQGPDCPSAQKRYSIDDEYTPAIFQSLPSVEKTQQKRVQCDWYSDKWDLQGPRGSEEELSAGLQSVRAGKGLRVQPAQLPFLQRLKPWCKQPVSSRTSPRPWDW